MSAKPDRSYAFRLDLRRRALRRFNLTELRVLDIGAGEGRLWTELCKTNCVAEYMPVDPEGTLPGCLRIKATQAFLQGLNLNRFNVIDLDVDTEHEVSGIGLAIVRVRHHDGVL